MQANTKILQQSILKNLLDNLNDLRTYSQTINEDWFDNDQRKYILNKIKECFKNSKSAYTKALFDYDIEKSFSEEDRTKYIIEWNYINGKKSEGTTEAIIKALKDASNSSKFADIMAEAIGLAQEGKTNDAVKLVHSKILTLDTEEDKKESVSIKDFDDILELIKDKKADPDKYKGTETGFPIYDRKTGGLFPAELIIISAVSGVGKSTLMKQFGVNLIESGKNVLHVCNEENIYQVRLKYMSLMTEVPYLDLKVPKYLSDENLSKFQKKMQYIKNNKRYGELVVKEIPQFTSIVEIEKLFVELEMAGRKPDVIIIDYLDHLKPVQTSYNENDEQAKIAADAKGLAISCNVPVVSATQASTEAEKKQTKGKAFAKYDIYGSKRKVHACNVLMYIVLSGVDLTQSKEAGGTKEEYECDKFWKIEIAKNRDGPLFYFNAKQILEIGKVITVAEGETNVQVKKEMDDIEKELENLGKPKDVPKPEVEKEEDLSHLTSEDEIPMDCDEEEIAEIWETAEKKSIERVNSLRQKYLTKK